MTDLTTGFSKSERYMAFLLASLPGLASFRLSGAASRSREAVLLTTLELIGHREGLCLEFGVYKGASISACARRFPTRTFHGFDSFEGFPSDGRTDWAQDFSVPGLPDIPPNVRLHKGWFSDTLPGFLKAERGDAAFLHVDCDIYSSTKEVFDLLGGEERIKPGLLIVFDELINYRNYLWNEMLAFFEMLDASGLGFRWVCVHDQVRPLEDTLEALRQKRYPAWKDDLASGFRQQASVVLTPEGIDYSLLAVPHAANRVRELARIFDTLSTERISDAKSG